MTTAAPDDGRPGPRGDQRVVGEGPRHLPARFALAGLVFLAVAAAVADLAYRPDLSRQREVLVGQLAESTGRLDRLRAELEKTLADQERIAANGLTADDRFRLTGEEYRSTEHALHDYARRVGHLRDMQARVLADADGYARRLSAIEQGDGRRRPYLTSLLAGLRPGGGR